MTETKANPVSHVEDSNAMPSKDVATELETGQSTCAAERKVDFRLIPLLIPLYAMSLIDRTNLGGARISGIDDALGLDQGSRYSVAILVFYVGYVFFELPSNIVLKKVGAPVWLSLLTVTFGICTIGMGLARNYATLIALRVILGCLEAGLFPGCIYLISSWYPRYAVQKRIAFFLSISSFISSFANILAYGLTQIADQPEKHGWRWIFIVQGCITCGVAVVSWAFLPDFPRSRRNKFLSEAQKASITARLMRDRGEAEDDKVTWKLIFSVAKEPHNWSIGFLYMGGSCGLYSFLFFLPVILRRSFGFSQEQAFYLCTPPAAFAVIFSVTVSWLSDRVRKRGIFVIFECVFAIIGLAMTGFLKSPGPRYVGTFLGMAGTTTLNTTALAWGQNNVRSDARRSVVTVIQVVCAAIGGVYSSLVFRQQDAPNYVPGIVATGSLLLAGIFVASGTMRYLWYANRKVGRGELVIENTTDFTYTL